MAIHNLGDFMKRLLTSLVIVLAGAISASATLYTYTASPGFSIPDDGSLNSFDIVVSGNPDNSISDVNVLLEFDGGYNADLYGYLVFNSTTVVLLNRIGITSGNAFGNSGAGMNVTLSDDGTGSDIHLATSGVLSGTYESDGRAISPLSSGSTFSSTARQNSDNPLGLFNGSNPNGTWTLFLADMSGEAQSELVSWGLVIDAVPEPITWALIIFGGVLGLVWLARSKWVREQIARCRIAITAWLDAA